MNRGGPLEPSSTRPTKNLREGSRTAHVDTSGDPLPHPQECIWSLNCIDLSSSGRTVWTRKTLQGIRFVYVVVAESVSPTFGPIVTKKVKKG